MDTRRAGVALFLVGLALLFAPLYWETLLRLGLASALDPAAAIGAAPGGGYPAAVGAAATAVGGVIARYPASENRPANGVLIGAIGGALLGVLAATVIATIPFLLAVQVGLAGAAPGFAAVRGGATGQARRRLGTGLVVLSLAPFAGAHIVRGLTVGGMAGFASVVLAIALLVYTAVLSYPFYRLGRAAQ